MSYYSQAQWILVDMSVQYKVQGARITESKYPKIVHISFFICDSYSFVQ